MVRESGRLDILVNNAGAPCPGESTRYCIEEIRFELLIGPVTDVDLDAARRAFETNFFAPMRLAQLVIPYMAEQGGGLVVNMGSIVGNV